MGNWLLASLSYFVMLLLSPLLFGIINRVKAIFAGRRGQPLLQTYFDLARLLQKDFVYSNTTSWIFRLTPLVALATVMIALMFLPFGSLPALLSFEGDLIFLAYTLGLGRFFLVIGALDVGSSFEGMGASREVMYAALSEMSFLMTLAVLAHHSDASSLAAIFSGLDKKTISTSLPAFVLISAAIFLISLAENCRVPFDDPNTHLELTMIHEVMVLDTAGPDFAATSYASTLKMWLFLGVMANVVVGFFASESTPINLLLFVGSVIGLAVTIGIVESSMARLRLMSTPQAIAGAGILSTLALILELRG